MKKVYVLLFVLLLSFVSYAPVQASDEKVSISGSSILTAKQMGDFVLLKYPEPKLTTVDIYRLADLYLSLGRQEGIRGDIAFAQAILETGYFQYGKDVLPEQNNYSGIGAVGGGAQGAYFNKPEEGVRAQIQHLKAYANNDPLVTEKIDPRFDYVKRGIAPYWTDLNNRWAVPGEFYGERILAIFSEMKRINLEIPNVGSQWTSKLPAAAVYLKADMPLISPDGSVAKTLKKGYSYKVFGTIGNNYNLGGNYYIAANSSKMSVYIGRLHIKNKDINLYRPDGKVHRKLVPGELIKVFSFDNNAYYVGGGYYIQRNAGVSFYKGTIQINADSSLYDSNGSVARTLKRGQVFRVYAIQNNKLDLGGGYYLNYDKQKQSYSNH
ncbi:glucosaminidase domain-containing protein [Bacillus sp. DTU_2020_1000418_1_SI_GHA_SEK_038]|uniref:glucosaminidase domain-containing protein n=1 Tax=Bacillus sp. DTU_2020_1000418_1_SI_GHA_SEK_038 TaxID=3077585 RepID=UPI0028E28AAC|nr:glucosaminidase domain-containing protein [Bacillus sp. DTU_2020_1000418_1_SI_GHA_SEK_038]WNS75131.1 glucosaminidase domain-containing protein [Bacillus sp. DTU_2020_1000418_1_SI_GHA_SEK_038]